MVVVNRTRRAAQLLSLGMMLITSCQSPDGRLADYAHGASEQQARQNHHMAEQSQAVARQSQELATAAHKLVEQDAAARRDLIQAQDNLQRETHAERTELDRQRAALEERRSAAAGAAVREPVIAQALITGALLVAALLPLIVTAYAVKRLPDQQAGHELLSSAMLEVLLAESSTTSAQSSGLPSNSFPPCLEAAGGRSLEDA